MLKLKQILIFAAAVLTIIVSIIIIFIVLHSFWLELLFFIAIYVNRYEINEMIDDNNLWRQESNDK